MTVASAPTAVLECRDYEHIELVACPSFLLKKTNTKLGECEHTEVKYSFIRAAWYATATLPFSCKAELEVPKDKRREPCDAPSPEGSDPNGERKSASCTNAKTLEIYNGSLTRDFESAKLFDELGYTLLANIARWCSEDGAKSAREDCDKRAAAWAKAELPKENGPLHNSGTLCCVEDDVVLPRDPFLDPDFMNP